MGRLFLLGFLFSRDLLAHPGHGSPGWIHPHVAEYALVGLGILVLLSGVFFLRRALKR